MNFQYRIIMKIFIVLIVLSTIVASFNYYFSLNNIQKQIKTQSLPLSLDNIYTVIQKNIVEPSLVSSMMANDTFVHDWLNKSTKNDISIVKYLNSIQKKYNMYNTFLVNNKTKKYYTQAGFVEVISNKNKNNLWYFDFIKSKNKYEINIDLNNKLSNSLIMFINYKIYDSKNNFLGVTGVALKTEYINKMLMNFRKKYGFKVTFFNKNGDVVLYEKTFNKHANLDTDKLLKNYKDKIISKTTNSIEIKYNGKNYFINTKYIPELDLYLIVEAQLNSYNKNLINMFYFNLLISLFIISFIAYVLYKIIKINNTKLEYLAYNDVLTDLYNRRHFEKELSDIILNNKRIKQDFCILFLDIDNFKDVNDKHGHDIGDDVLRIIADILKQSLRQTDIIARWGGEEIIVVFTNTTIVNAKKLSENIRIKIQNDTDLFKLLNSKITASFGLTQFKDDDCNDSIVKRADEAMYLSKTSGKNKITII